MKLRVEVQDRHVAAGERCRAHRCPAALAANDALQAAGVLGERRALIYDSVYLARLAGEWWNGSPRFAFPPEAACELPVDVREAIGRYDAGAEFELPCAFELVLPE